MAQGGLNLVGVVSRRTAVGCAARKGTRVALRCARSLLVCGSGGRGHWEAIPEEERSDQLCVHRAGVRAIQNALPHLGRRARLLGVLETSAFDLRRLAVAAGFGLLSPYLQIVIHPTFGPWVSIRGIVATSERFPRDRRARLRPLHSVPATLPRGLPVRCLWPRPLLRVRAVRRPPAARTRTRPALRRRLPRAARLRRRHPTRLRRARTSPPPPRQPGRHRSALSAAHGDVRLAEHRGCELSAPPLAIP